MQDIEKIKQDLKQILSEKRYNHSLGVMEKAEELALQYSEDIETAKLVGLAHDIAKEMPKEEIEKYIKSHNIEIDEIETMQPFLLHGKIGANICMEKYAFNKQMQDAIIKHTTGDINMTLLDKIIYLADKIEKNREYADAEYARNLAKKDIDEAILYCLNISIQRIIKKGSLIHPNTIMARNKMITQLGTGKSGQK